MFVKRVKTVEVETYSSTLSHFLSKQINIEYEVYREGENIPEYQR